MSDTPQPNYKIYPLDHSLKIVGTEAVHAESDEAAIAIARERMPDRSCEIWTGDRMVGRIEAAATTRKQRKIETAQERSDRLEGETQRRLAETAAEDDAVHAMIKRSIEQHGA